MWDAKNCLFVSFYIELLHRTFKALFFRQQGLQKVHLFYLDLNAYQLIFWSNFSNEVKNWFWGVIQYLFYSTCFLALSLWTYDFLNQQLFLYSSFFVSFIFRFSSFLVKFLTFLIAFLIIRGILNLSCCIVSCLLGKCLSILVRKLDTMLVTTLSMLWCS